MMMIIMVIYKSFYTFYELRFVFILVDEADARLVVEAGISPPVSPESRVTSMAILGNESNCEDDDQIVIEGENPLGPRIVETKSSQSLRVMSPNDINYISNKKRPSDIDIDHEPGM